MTGGRWYRWLPLVASLLPGSGCSPSRDSDPSNDATSASTAEATSRATADTAGPQNQGSGGAGKAEAADSTAATGSPSRGTGGISASGGSASGGGASGGGAAENGGTRGSTTASPPGLDPLTLYYLDVTEDQVMALPAEGGQPRVVIEGAGQGPDGIAADAQNGHLYWTNMGVPAEDDGFILRSDANGRNVITIIEPGETFTPKQLKLDEATRQLYWGDREGMRVMRASLDGSELETVVTIAEGDRARNDRENHVVGVAVDSDAGHVYWVQKGAPNAGEGSIRRAGLSMPPGENSANRTDIEVLYANLPEPIDLDVDVEAGMLYWTDRGDATVNRAPISIPAGSTAASRTDREILVRNVEVAIGIWLDLGEGHVYYTGNDVVGRVDLDGQNPLTLVENAGVLTGITGVRLPADE